MSSWPRLSHVATMAGRIGWQNLRAEDFTDEGPYLVTGMHFRDGAVDWDACYHVDDERWAMAPEIQLRPHDVLFTKDGSIGKLAYIDTLPDRATLNSHLLVIRPRRSEFSPRYLYWVLASELMTDYIEVAKRGTTFHGISQEAMERFRLPLPPLAEQRAIADYLDAETARIDALIAKKQQLIHLLEERIDAAIMEVVGRSEIVVAGGEQSVEIRRVLEKLDRAPMIEEMITAFRDGQVTTRSARGKDRFTNSWTDNARVQGVQVGDVVVHGLDGFSGAIGDSEADGVCSPVYHVCRPRDGGDPAYYGRLLRRLALTGYLGNFAVSTRERAVDFRNWDLFGRIPIPLVPVSQQREIGDRIRKLRPLVELVERSEALAAERKSALISRAVSGEARPSVGARVGL